MTKLDSRLQDSLEQIEAGADPEAVIAALPPADAAEIGELIRLAVAVKRLPAPSPARMALPASVAAAARDLRDAQGKPPRFRMRELASQAYVIGFAALMLAVFAGVFIIPPLIEGISQNPTATFGPSPTDTPAVATLDQGGPTSEVIEGTATIAAAETPTPTATKRPSIFHLIKPSPIVLNGSGSDWDANFTDPGAVIALDGQLVMFRNGTAEASIPSPYAMAITTTEDGSTWTTELPFPVFKDHDIPYSHVSALVTGATEQDDGSLAVYFYTYGARTLALARSVIGRATANSLYGTWTPDPEPLIEPGPPGSWDDFAVRHPSVVRVNGVYLMYYTGLDGETGLAIGLAKSADGVTWFKYDDPATGGAYAQSDPILVPSEKGNWDSLFVSEPSVVQSPDGLVMLYRGSDGLDKGGLGIALSQNGADWERYAGNPAFTASQIPGAKSFQHITLAYLNDVFYLFAEVTNQLTQGTNIWLAIHEGAIE